ncbi:chemotaxis phosphatase, CheZ [Desulfovibrio sp. X2]|uniref:protein phosphatase CheZ n=1 Tax=Desulfovibrio sp. X2 TaxID=941449 RepID=UPI0003588159|nr:protein phosphatase CheZ [Desulfovibrio sp. X2]EPR42257.1 chemotaxis phosphatase, CheZ [Desulfovibrio sp. X2]
MNENEKFIASLLDKVSDRIASDLRQSVAVSVEKEMQKNISRMLVEGEFFRHLSGELQDGLRLIYREINTATKNDGGEEAEPPLSRERTGQLLLETSDQLDQILQTTEQAAVQIMDIVEKHMDRQAEVAEKLRRLQDGGAAGESGDLSDLLVMNEELGTDLMTIMTALSFQDLTGQRIKRVIGAVKQIERITFELFMGAGLKIKAKEQFPEKDLDTIEAEARQRVSELKGPQKEASQGDVDDLLSQLGMD